jgi:hypothetical protein
MQADRSFFHIFCTSDDIGILRITHINQALRGMAYSLKITKIVLDVMSPAQQSIIDLVEKLNSLDGISQVDVAVQELEKNVEDLKVTLDGYGLNYGSIAEMIKDFGAVIRNVDCITSAKEHSQRGGDESLSASMLVLAKHVDAKTSQMSQIHSEFDETLKHVRSKRT